MPESRGLTKFCVVTGLVTFITVVVVLMCVFFVSLDSRRFLGVDGVIEGLRLSIPEQAALVDGVHDVTTVECHGEVNCTQAAKSSKITIFHFDRKEDASSFSETLGTDGVVSDRIVVRIDDATVGSDERLHLKEFLDGIWQSE